MRGESKHEYCSYCGDIAETIDHVPPISFYPKTLTHIGTRRRASIHELPWVWCCRECNLLLSNLRLLTLENRAEYIADKLRKRHSGVINIPDWTDEEIAELGPGLRDAILGIFQTGNLYSGELPMLTWFLALDVELKSLMRT